MGKLNSFSFCLGHLSHGASICIYEKFNGFSVNLFQTNRIWICSHKIFNWLKKKLINKIYENDLIVTTHYRPHININCSRPMAITSNLFCNSRNLYVGRQIFVGRKILVNFYVMNAENASVTISVLQAQDADVRSTTDEQSDSDETKHAKNENPSIDSNALDSDTYMSDNDKMPCRICLSSDTETHAMISPCLCKGSIANVHATCLEQWLSQKGNNRCDLCTFEFQVFSTPKYTMVQSLVVWVKHPRNRAFFMYDTAVFLILNILTGVVIAMFIRNMNSVVDMKIAEYGITMWFLASGIAAVVFWLIVYCLAVSLFINAQVRPWYQWWKASRSIRLVINA